MEILGWFARRAKVGEAGVFSARAIRLFGQGGWLGGGVRLFFRARFEGWERIVEPAPCLIVVNHSGGGGGDVAVLATQWAETFAREHTLAAMAHPLTFMVPGVARLVRSFGAIPSAYEVALETLRGGTSVLVFPGGDHEAFRPLWEARRVDFNGRQGFLRLAREAEVPILPVGLRGTHYTVPILWRSRALASSTSSRDSWGSSASP